jgi:hypothetical protein
MSTVLSPQGIPVVVNRLYEAAARYGQRDRLPADRDAFTHDLRVMAEHDDLRALRLELLDHAGTLVWSYAPDVESRAWPVLAPSAIAAGRVIVDRAGREALYRSRLRLPWSPCARAHPGAVDDLGGDDGHHRVGATNRLDLVVRSTGPRFAFARCEALGRDDVFLAPIHAPAGMRFFIGQRLTAAVVGTRQGVQARAIRPA